MSFVGEPFEHDVFVSYAHAEPATDSQFIHGWSWRVTNKTHSLLTSSLRHARA